MTTAAEGVEDPGVHIDPDLRADDHEGWARRLGRAMLFLFRAVR